ncbi:MAG: A/G-specific adenine glycosylase [Minisyncoccia bacterium]
MVPSKEKESIAKFRRIVWNHYEKEGRHTLPWRETHNPYRILVSEIMLQQTQVERVIPFYKNFLKKFPTVRKLAAAPLSEVLRAWQGLGYNRRAKMLHAAANCIVTKHGGVFPKDVATLQSLPGVGPYTARAVAAFACNEDVIFVETNIRTVVMHHFFPKREKVADSDIEEVVERALPKGNAREWYGALMDYGSHLKRSGVRINKQSTRYTPQSAFSGSLREARGAILRILASGPKKVIHVEIVLGTDRTQQVHQALGALMQEGFVEIHYGKLRLSS